MNFKSAIIAISLLGLSTPAALADNGIKIGAEHRDERTAITMTVSNPVGPVMGSLSMKTNLPKGKARSDSELVAGGKYVLPVTVYGATPYVTGELGLASARKNNVIVGAEAGITGPISGNFSWDAAVRVRDTGGDNSSRVRAGVIYKLDETLSLGADIIRWHEKHDTDTGFGLSVSKKF